MAGPQAPSHLRNLNATLQNGTAGRADVASMIITNSTAASAFVQIFDTTGTVTLATTVPMMSIHIPAASATLDGTTEVTFNFPIYFENRMQVAGTTTAEGNTGVADGVFMQVFLQ